MHRFRSSRYPEVSATVLAGLAIGRPLSVCLLPLMIAASVMMLGGRDPLPFLLVSTPAAAAVAWFWARQELRGTVVEVNVVGSSVAVRSAWDVATGRAVGPGDSVLDVRREGDRILLTLGLDTVRLAASDFPESDSLVRRLEEARSMHGLEVRARIDSQPPGPGANR